MAAERSLFILFSLTLAFIEVTPVNYQPRAIQLMENSWPDILEGEWMVEFMAPWCPACRAFQATWDEFAKKWSRDLDVSVATVDVTQNPGLSGRFLITSLPSIYHVKNGVFRQYMGGRTEVDLITFVDDKKWSEVEPVSKWTNPNSIQMSMVGLFFKLAMRMRAFYTMMTEEYGIPEWGCYIIFAVLTIIAGLVLGLLLVCICDFISPAKQYPPPIPAGLMHPDRDKEGDIIDDTTSGDGDTQVRRRNVGFDVNESNNKPEEGSSGNGDTDEKNDDKKSQ